MRAKLETIWEARILGCLQQFVAKKKHVDTELVCYALVTIIFSLARDPRLASSVVKNGLHGLLSKLYFESRKLDVQSPKTPMLSSDSNKNTQDDQDQVEIVDARDLLLSIDPFDWCFQSTCIQITADKGQQQKKKKIKKDAVFFVPIGARSLNYLLVGEALPTDEITEYDTKLRLNPGKCGHSSQSLSPTKKTRRLPSIFTFPTVSDRYDNSLVIATNVNSNSICSRKDNPALQVARSHSALQHMVLRAAAALLQNLRRPSPERKLLLQDGKCIKILVVAIHSHDDNGLPDQHSTKPLGGGDRSVLLLCQKVAIQPHTLARIAQCGLSLVHKDELDAFMKTQPQLKEPLVKQQPSQQSSTAPVASSASRPSSSSTKTHNKPKTQKRQAVGVLRALSLSERLQAASEESRREIATEGQHASSLLKRELELERSLRRQQLRTQCNSLEQLRVQLSESLALLHNGRQHADPTQSFASWIVSLPTIEKKEQERQSADLMRQQHAIEMQFQHEEARKQRLREYTMMQQNDSDAPNETEHDRREQKRLEFLRMHEEMRLLQLQQQQEGQRLIGGGDMLLKTGASSDHDDQQVSEIQARMLHAETLAAQRKARQKKLDDEQTQLLRVRQRKQEVKELERMAREDLYYVEKLLRAKQLEVELRKQQQLSAKQTGNPIAEQQRKIERMRQLDLERSFAEKESERMRTEDLVARQLRYVNTEHRRLEAQQEKLARKYMEAQERECRALWTRLEQEQKKLDELEAKRLRVETRKLLKLQRQYDNEVLAAWTDSWDEYGNAYYYNTFTGVSQWEKPLTPTIQ